MSLTHCFQVFGVAFGSSIKTESLTACKPAILERPGDQKNYRQGGYYVDIDRTA
jgi:hypothetical protein